MAVLWSRPNTAARWEGVGPVAEGLFELAVDAESFEGCRMASERLLGPEGADRAGFHGGLRLMIRCGLAVYGQRACRWSSQPARAWRVRS